MKNAYGGGWRNKVPTSAISSTGEEIKPVMAYVQQNRLSTDVVYVYYGADPAFKGL
jgi:hypothetical protein